MICTTAGDISVKVPASLESKLDLKADSVSVDKQLDMTSVISTKSDVQEHLTGIIQHMPPASAGSPSVSFLILLQKSTSGDKCSTFLQAKCHSCH